jgi:hypothetical protein
MARKFFSLLLVRGFALQGGWDDGARSSEAHQQRYGVFGERPIKNKVFAVLSPTKKAELF